MAPSRIMKDLRVEEGEEIEMEAEERCRSVGFTGTGEIIEAGILRFYRDDFVRK